MPVVMELDRNWENTRYAGIALRRQLGEYHGFSVGFSYDSSPVEDADRTLDLPMDEIFNLSAVYVWQGKREFDFPVGGTLLLAGMPASTSPCRVVDRWSVNSTPMQSCCWVRHCVISSDQTNNPFTYRRVHLLLHPRLHSSTA